MERGETQLFNIRNPYLGHNKEPLLINEVNRQFMNEEQLKQVFVTALDIDPDKVTDALAYNTIPEWDSTAHMMLVAEIENQFDVMLDTDDIIDMSSFAKAKAILSKYLG